MDLLSISEFAAARGVSQSRVMAWVAQDRLPGARKIGRAWVVPAGADPGVLRTGRPKKLPQGAGSPYRELEARLLDIAAGPAYAPRWKSVGDDALMAGIAVLLASDSSFHRQTYLHLASRICPAMLDADVFRGWLEKGPIRPSRFIPMVRDLKRQRARHGNVSAMPIG